MAEEFCAVTGASESEAAEYLERCNGDGKLAMERFFEESKAIEQRRIREGDLARSTWHKTRDGALSTCRGKVDSSSSRHRTRTRL